MVKVKSDSHSFSLSSSSCGSGEGLETKKSKKGLGVVTAIQQSFLLALLLILWFRIGGRNGGETEV